MYLLELPAGGNELLFGIGRGISVYVITIADCSDQLRSLYKRNREGAGNLMIGYDSGVKSKFV
ncbi:MAG: hypothetical protein IT392_13470 [Nitrospirae bacterium]|nr:hypothetical protein [Nitrospirota bacterium]